jgi:hypothetical protein
VFDVPEFRTLAYAVLLLVIAKWRWATWRRAWVHSDHNRKDCEPPSQDQHLRQHFNFFCAYDYSTILRRQMRRGADSWGLREYWSVFQTTGLAVFPPRALVTNDNVDGSGSYGRVIIRHLDNSLALVADIDELLGRTQNKMQLLRIFEPCSGNFVNCSENLLIV